MYQRYKDNYNESEGKLQNIYVCSVKRGYVITWAEKQASPGLSIWAFFYVHKCL